MVEKNRQDKISFVFPKNSLKIIKQVIYSSEKSEKKMLHLTCTLFFFKSNLISYILTKFPLVAHSPNDLLWISNRQNKMFQTDYKNINVHCDPHFALD